MTYKDETHKNIDRVNSETGPLPVLSAADLPVAESILTGFTRLDKGLNGGLQLGRAYLIASVEKSGKTSFLRKMLLQISLNGTSVGIIDVEQQEDFFVKAMSSLLFNKKLADITTKETTSMRDGMNDHITYVNRINGDYLISNQNGEIEVEKCIKVFERMIDEQNVKVCVFDNVTPLASEGRKASSNQRMMMMNGLVSLAKRKSVVVIVVGHINASTQELIAESKVKDILNGHSDPESIVRESIITVKRPLTKDVYGGSILTQFDAKFFIWRPFQNYGVEKYRQYAWLMVEDCRYSPPFMVPMFFRGESLDFIEIPEKSDNEIFNNQL